MKYNFDGGKITIIITRKDLKTIIENEGRWNGCKILDMDKLIKNIAKALVSPIFDEGDGVYSAIDKAVEDTAYELFTSGANYLEDFSPQSK